MEQLQYSPLQQRSESLLDELTSQVGLKSTFQNVTVPTNCQQLSVISWFSSAEFEDWS